MRIPDIVPIAGLPVLLLAAMLAWLGSYSLLQPDEGRNAEVAREMVASGNYVVPHLNGIVYVDKPALHYAITAVTMKVFGVNEFAARLPSLVFTVLTALVIGWFGRRLWNPQVGWTAAVLLLASPLTFLMARVVILDAVLSFLLVASLVSFYLACDGYNTASTNDATDRVRPAVWKRWSIVAWLAIGLGILTKGPVALLLPLLVSVPFAVKRHSLRAVFHWPAVILAFAIAVPWVLQMQRHLPDYLHYVLVTETLKRVGTDQLHRSQPFWYFVPVLAAGAFPWIVLLAASLWRGRKELRSRSDPRELFLLLWIVVPFLFFSMSHSKLPHYMLPLVPAVALLTASRLARDDPAAASGRRVVAGAWCVLGALLVTASFMPQVVAKLETSLVEPVRHLALLLGVVALIVGVIGWSVKLRGPWLAFTFALPITAVALGGGPLFAAVGETRSAKALATAIATQLPGDRRVVGIGAYPTALPFYLGSPIFVSSRTGKELTSNYVVAAFDRLVKLPDSSLLGPDGWQDILHECRQPTAFVIDVDDSDTSRELIAAGAPLIASDRKYGVYGPCRKVDAAPTMAGAH